jgi:hypothetical protein
MLAVNGWSKRSGSIVLRASLPSSSVLLSEYDQVLLEESKMARPLLLSLCFSVF